MVGRKKLSPTLTEADAVMTDLENHAGSNGGDVGRRGKKRKAAEAAPSPTPSPAAEKRKRGRKVIEKVAAKKVKLGFGSAVDRMGESGGVVLAVGQGDTGQLGLGEDILDRSKPAWVKSIENVVNICAGGMHSVCINNKGEVFSFGCNDEGALGRETKDDDECYTPAKVNIPGKVVQITAGDSHTVALTEDGKAYYWGTFRDSSGSFGLTEKGIEKLPIPLAPEMHVVRIASGSDHVAFLTSGGELYTVGCGEQGQLGRVGQRYVNRGGENRKGLEILLRPEEVQPKNKKIVFKDVWAGSYSTYALTANDDVLVCGLNNYNQLGIEKGQLFYTLRKSPSFSNLSKEHGCQSISPGQHHALALDKSGNVYAIGRVEYGRLGLGSNTKTDARVPIQISGLSDVVNVACGTAVSFAVKKSGQVLSWGMGTNGQLAHEDEDDAWEPTAMMGKQLETRNVFMAAGGGQHTILLAKEK